MEKIKTVVVAGGAFNATAIAGKTFEQFKAEADEATKANKSAYFGEWPADQRELKLREVFDASVKEAKPKEDHADKKPGSKA